MTTPIFLSPALPSELLLYILKHHVYPTTLIICSSQADLITEISEDISAQSRGSAPNIAGHQELDEGEPVHHQTLEKEDGDGKHALLSSSLYQIATSRHIRVVYVPTVTHLRAFLSVFSPDESGLPAPPLTLRTDGKARLIIYGLVHLHRDTSEWSAQGLSNTASALVESTHRLSWRTLIIEPLSGPSDTALEELLQEIVPILKGGARRPGLAFEEGAWSGRTVEVGRVLGRWFRFQRAQWNNSDYHDSV